jgi:hypothetical protein
MPQASTLISLRQNAEYTFKQNITAGRHGWLRLTPAYSVTLVNRILAGLQGNERILDPFSGTATTPLSASEAGFSAVSVDINPFLVWFGNAKLHRYTESELLRAEQCAERVLREYDTNVPISFPPIHNIERWWNASELHHLASLKATLERVVEDSSPEKNILLIAFCRQMMRLSNAAFNHQSMSFKQAIEPIPQTQLFEQASFGLHMQDWRKDVEFVVETARQHAPVLEAKALLGDGRRIDEVCRKECLSKFDCVITSPPYPNRMSYIRELRPYMYWLGFLNQAREAGELDWQAIGGTWGIATSRLNDWQAPSNGIFMPSKLRTTLDIIAAKDEKNSVLLARYIEKYFADMWLHFQALQRVLAPNAQLHYIVGNSTFYETLLPVEELYVAMLRELGFINVGVATIRKRNSKKELFEFHITATKT